jgi:hypothetical protein
MAKIKLQPEASSSNVFTIATPAGSSNRTLTLPDTTGTLLTADGDGSSLTGISSVGGATGVDFNDNVKIRAGTGNDLEIYHDGSNSYITDAGTGNLYLRASNAVIMQSADGGETLASFHDDNLCRLYYDNSIKLETTATGVAVTGGVAIGGTGAANTLDDYEEGTFTVTSSDSGGGFYGTGGHYVKVGGIVHIRAYFGDIAGGVSFAGLPFAAEVSTGFTIHQMYQVNWPSSAKQLLCYVSGSTIQFRWQTDTGTGLSITSTDTAHSSCTFGIAGTYKTTA